VSRRERTTKDIIRKARKPRADGSAQREARWWKQRRLRGRFGLLIAAAVAILLAAASALFILSRPSGNAGPPSAAIIDQLSLTFPNPQFVEAVTRTLEEAGYTVDYYPGEQVTVDFYRYLPAKGYDLLIFRVHAARRPEVLASKLPDEASLFTSEPYSRTKYVDDQNALRLVKVSYQEGDPEVFFGIRSTFITSSMKGKFPGATVILMGCDTLRGRATAEAFIKKGAKAVVGWSDLVSASHTDEATERLLQKVTLEGLSIQEAVEQTNQEVGPDPVYGSTLLYTSGG